jgi:dTDP-4-amino-4,6-dideoxy-D-galactose acyltransferase
LKPTDEPICTYLDWDSQFFELRIARLNRQSLDEASLKETLSWCRSNHIDCVYFLANSEDARSCRLADRNGFFQTDVRMTLERRLSLNDLMPPPGGTVRPAREGDFSALRAIAREGHRDTRFHFDEHFDRAKCDLLYETWIENSFKGFAQAVLVAEAEGAAVGYITCHLENEASRIGIVGVADGQRGAGLGTHLVRHFLAWSVRQGARKATVVTQGRNVPAQRLYQRTGFVTASFQLWYHRWSTS